MSGYDSAKGLGELSWRDGSPQYMGIGQVAGLEGRKITFRLSSEKSWSQRTPPLLSIDLCHILPMMLGKSLPVVVLKHDHKIL